MPNTEQIKVEAIVLSVAKDLLQTGEPVDSWEIAQECAYTEQTVDAAIHRLAKLGLVLVEQGKITSVVLERRLR